MPNTYKFAGRDGQPLTFIGERPPTPAEMMQLSQQPGRPTDFESVRAGFRRADPKTLIRDLVIGAGKGAAKTAVGISELLHKVPGVSAVTGVRQPAFEEARKELTSTNAAQEVGEFGERMAEFLYPIFKVGEVAKGVTTGARLANWGINTAKQAVDFAAKTAAQTGGDPEAIISAALWGAAVPAVLGLGRAAKGATTEVLPEALYTQIFKSAEDDMLKAYETAARGQSLNPTLAKEMLDRGLRGSSRNMAVYSVKKLDAVEQQLRASLVGKFVKLPQKQDYIGLLNDISTEMGGAFAKTGQEAAALSTRLTKGIRGPYVSATDALTLKRFLDRARNTSSFRFSAKLSPKQEEYKEAADLVRGVIHQTFPKASELLNEERVFIQGLDAIVSDATKRNNRRLLGLTDYILGGGGMASGFGVSGVGAAATVRGFQNPFTLTNLGYWLNRIGRAAPPPQAATAAGATGALATRPAAPAEAVPPE